MSRGDKKEIKEKDKKEKEKDKKDKKEKDKKKKVKKTPINTPDMQTKKASAILVARGFLTAAGTQLKHGPAIKDLMDALFLPEQVAVLKVKAHGRLNSQEARGNHLVDIAAKQAATNQRKWPKRRVNSQCRCVWQRMCHLTGYT